MRSSHFDDTIAAVATPVGKGAIAVIRVSGKDALDSLSDCFRKKGASQRARNLKVSVPGKAHKIEHNDRIFGVIIAEDRIIDEVILSIYRKPYSYTGEDVVEISCHCNTYIIKEIMRLLLKKCRLAEPGEFTQRAFLNNKIDLTQAEAVGDLLNAATKASHQSAMQQLEGSLRKHICELLEELTQYRIELELEIDFSEQELPEIDLLKLKKRLSEFCNKLQKLVQTGKEGRILREGLAVCLAGQPNVGKSSLFNRLLQSERAIVTAQPGTTRDYLEESLSIEGYLVRLIDTAGLRDTQEEAEAIGVGISYQILSQADKIIHIKEPESMDIEPGAECRELKSEAKVIRVLNKCDLLDDDTLQNVKAKGLLPVSAKTGEGLEELKKRLIAELSLEKKDIDEGILTNLRQINAVEKSLAAIVHSLQSLDEEMGFEFTAFDLKVASEALEEIIGKITDDDLLNKIFADFCIGK